MFLFGFCLEAKSKQEHIQQTETGIDTDVTTEDDINLGGNTICGNTSGSAFADYSVYEDLVGVQEPALRST